MTVQQSYFLIAAVWALVSASVGDADTPAGYFWGAVGFFAAITFFAFGVFS